MGLPIAKLICASNSNNVLTEFLESGIYNRNRAFHCTISPSMDILISSNLERLIFIEFGSQKTSEYMAKLTADGEYSLTQDEISQIQKNFIGYYSSEEETQKTIKETFEKKNCLIDTHTAVAINAIHRYINDHKAERKILAVSTASPYKFAKDVLFSITQTSVSDDIDALYELEKLTKVEIPAPLKNIEKREIIHLETIKKEDMKTSTLEFAKN